MCIFIFFLFLFVNAKAAFWCISSRAFITRARSLYDELELEWVYFVYTQWSLFQQLEIAGKQGNIGPAQISLAKLLCGKAEQRLRWSLQAVPGPPA